MDVVIEQLVESSRSWDKETLVLVTGDHGMKDSGGHGGTTYAETHVPLMVFGNFTSRSNEAISQTDIPTTLSTLFAIEIPPSSIGKTVQYFVKDYELEEQLYILYYNLLVLRRNSNICEENFVKATQMHKDYLKHYDPKKGKQIYDLYYGCINTISENLVQSSVQQNTVFLIFSMILSINCLILIATKVNAYNVYLYVILLSFFLTCNTQFYYIPLICAMIATIKSLKFQSYNLIPTIPIVLHAILLQSSSFIEEEHQIYLFFTCSVSLILSYLSLKTSILTSLIPLLIIISFRFLRKMNSTGDMWASYPDFSDWLLREDNFNYYQIFFATSLIFNLIILSYFYKPKVLQRCFFAVTFFAIFVFKMHFTNDPQLGKFIWFIIGLSSIALKGNLFKKLITTWVLIITLLLRPYNILLIPACILISAISVKRVQSIEILNLIHSWLGFSLFFCQGHSNSIASIDLAPAYIGLESYIPFIVFTITICHTYAFQILSTLLLMNEKKYEIDEVLQTNVIYRLVILITIYSVTFIQRGHLFVWSVFAPKLLIESVHSVVLFFIYCIVIVLQKIVFNKL
ncbi:PREDICTED: GPI ethanolamine phosphate transferase 2-like [Nicrophorus vespilloides]|uniref:GPI ethanolamine phosphate transferase 2-like n=1 Tax=Nicrophorus vespilloides TaxID=110193 RepID=A0ABM1MSA6_NICVS|nr:PREDICTED: GPI ethanolamine phosphate transferase 2-like [Nicrophorus vespilloides]